MKNRLIILISFIALFSSCSDDFGNMNQDTKNPTTTSPEFLFTNAEKFMVDQVTSTSVNFNVFRLYAQHWAEVQYPQETQYDLTGRTIPDRHWATYYRDVLRDYKEAKKLLLEQKASILELQKV